MKLLTKSIESKLRTNAKRTANAQKYRKDEPDHKPVLKVFNPCGAATWLFTELDEDGRLFGLCDLGFGTPELGYASLEELQTVKVGKFGLGLERDLHFRATKRLSEYAEEARKKGRIEI